MNKARYRRAVALKNRRWLLGINTSSIPTTIKKQTVRSWKVKVFTRYQYLTEIISGKVITQNQEFTTEIKAITRYQNLIIVLKGRKYWKQEPSTDA